MTSSKISSDSGFTRVLAHRARRIFPLAVVVVVLALAAGTLAGAGLPGLTGKIAYTCRGNICLFHLTSGTNTQFAVSGVNPKISPDGTRIAFQGRDGIYVMNADGTNPTSVSSFGGVPGWSPDGKKIAFDSNGIWVMNADGSGLQQVANHGLFDAWSPATTLPPQIAFSSDLYTSDLDLWSMNPDGTDPRRILSRPGADIDVVWSSSGQIVFGGYVDKKTGYEIFAFNPGTLILNRLTNSPGADYEPAASPDGSKIAFSSGRKSAGIYIMNADGSSPQLIIAGGRQPSWGP